MKWLHDEEWNGMNKNCVRRKKSPEVCTSSAQKYFLIKKKSSILLPEQKSREMCHEAHVGHMKLKKQLS